MLDGLIKCPASLISMGMEGQYKHANTCGHSSSILNPVDQALYGDGEQLLSLGFKCFTKQKMKL